MAPPRKNRARRVALGGLLSSLSLLLMVAGGLLPVATFAAPAFAGLCLLPVAIEMGTKTALVAYGAVSALSMLLVADREMVLFFILLLGYYPVVQFVFAKIRHRGLRLAAKFALFNVAVAGVYALFLPLFAPPAVREQLLGEAWWMLLGMLLVGNLAFFLYDKLIDKLRHLYLCRWRGRIFRS